MTEPAAAPVPGPGLLSRAIGIITSPTATFEAVVRAPSALGALALVALLIGLTAGVFFSTEVGQTAFMDQMAQQGGNPEAITQMERMLPYMGLMWGAGALVWVVVFAAILSGLLWAVFNAGLGGTATYKQVLAIVAHSQIVSVVGNLITFSLNYYRGTMTSATNFSVFMPSLDETSFLAKFLGAMDLFLLWWIVVLAIGMAVLYRRKAGGVATGLLIFYGVIALCIAYFTAG